MQEMWVPSLGREDPLEEGMATHSSLLAWRTPWTEAPGGLQSMGSQRIGHNLATDISRSLLRFGQLLCLIESSVKMETFFKVLDKSQMRVFVRPLSTLADSAMHTCLQLS